MILNIFQWLSSAIQSNPSAALAASFGWGCLSILLSPCHLVSIPLIIGFLNEQGTIPLKKAVKITLLFASGILITIAVLGIITASLGRLIGDVGKWVNYLVGVIFFIMALSLLDVIRIPVAGINARRFKGGDYISALTIGLLFGIALGPCTFAYLAPVLGIVFRISASNLLYGIFLLLSFALGHCFIIVFAGVLYEKVQQYLNWTEKTKSAVILRKICGVFVFLGGVYLIYTTVKI